MASKSAASPPPYPSAARISDSECYPQYSASLKCLEEYSKDRSKCQEQFDNYKECKKREVNYVTRKASLKPSNTFCESYVAPQAASLLSSSRTHFNVLMADQNLMRIVRERINRLTPQAPVEPVATDNILHPPLAVPRGMDALKHFEIDMDRKINEYLKTVPDLPTVPEQYLNLPDLTTNMSAVTTDFPDSKFLKTSSIMLEHKDDGEIARMGRMFVPMLISGFSPQGVGAFLVMAYNLRNNDIGDKHVIPEEDEIATPLDINYTELSTSVIATGQPHDPFPATQDVEMEAKVYTFLAASTLRIFTKSENNYLSAWGHITKGFQRFHGSPINVPIVTPKIETLQSLSYFYTNNPIFKNTLYKILYSSGASQATLEMRKFLYEIHLVNTGHHIVSIFVRLCDVLNCPTTDVIAAVYSPEFERTLSVLIKMINLVVRNDKEHERKMWRYGRLFDETFMAPLQTKKCPTLTYILAAALQSESAATNKNILKIAQLADVGPEKQKACVTMGEMLVRSIRKKATKGTAS